MSLDLVLVINLEIKVKRTDIRNPATSPEVFFGPKLYPMMSWQQLGCHAHYLREFWSASIDSGNVAPSHVDEVVA